MVHKNHVLAIALFASSFRRPAIPSTENRPQERNNIEYIKIDSSCVFAVIFPLMEMEIEMEIIFFTEMESKNGI